MKEIIDITEQELDELFEKYRQFPDSHVFVPLADACRKMNRVEEALEICDRGVSRHPDYASGYVVRGKCLYKLERHDEALEVFGKVLSLDANNLVAHKYLGIMEAAAGRIALARKHLKHILRLDPQNREIKTALSDVEAQQQVDATPTPDAFPGDGHEAGTEGTDRAPRVDTAFTAEPLAAEEFESGTEGVGEPPPIDTVLSAKPEEFEAESIQQHPPEVL